MPSSKKKAPPGTRWRKGYSYTTQSGKKVSVKGQYVKDPSAKKRVAPKSSSAKKPQKSVKISLKKGGLAPYKLSDPSAQRRRSSLKKAMARVAAEKRKAGARKGESEQQAADSARRKLQVLALQRKNADKGTAEGAQCMRALADEAWLRRQYDMKPLNWDARQCHGKSASAAKRAAAAATKKKKKKKARTPAKTTSKKVPRASKTSVSLKRKPRNVTVYRESGGARETLDAKMRYKPGDYFEYRNVTYVKSADGGWTKTTTKTKVGDDAPTKQKTKRRFSPPSSTSLLLSVKSDAATPVAGGVRAEPTYHQTWMMRRKEKPLQINSWLSTARDRGLFLTAGDVKKWVVGEKYPIVYDVYDDYYAATVPWRNPLDPEKFFAVYKREQTHSKEMRDKYANEPDNTLVGGDGLYLIPWQNLKRMPKVYHLVNPRDVMAQAFK